MDLIKKIYKEDINKLDASEDVKMFIYSIKSNGLNSVYKIDYERILKNGKLIDDIDVDILKNELGIADKINSANSLGGNKCGRTKTIGAYNIKINNPRYTILMLDSIDDKGKSYHVYLSTELIDEVYFDIRKEKNLKERYKDKLPKNIWGGTLRLDPYRGRKLSPEMTSVLTQLMPVENGHMTELQSIPVSIMEDEKFYKNYINDYIPNKNKNSQKRLEYFNRTLKGVINVKRGFELYIKEEVIKNHLKALELSERIR